MTSPLLYTVNIAVEEGNPIPFAAFRILQEARDYAHKAQEEGFETQIIDQNGVQWT